MIITWYNKRAMSYGKITKVQDFYFAPADSVGDLSMNVYRLNDNHELQFFDVVLTPEQLATLHVDSVEPLETSGLGEAMKEARGGYYFPD